MFNHSENSAQTADYRAMPSFSTCPVIPQKLSQVRGKKRGQLIKSIVPSSSNQGILSGRIIASLLRHGYLGHVDVLIISQQAIRLSKGADLRRYPWHTCAWAENQVLVASIHP